MKIKNTIKLFIAMLIVPAFYSSLHAQDFKTNESIRSQLIKGTAPGLKFAPATAAKKQVNDDNTGTGQQGLISQIRKGIAPNMQFKTSQGGGAVANNAMAAKQPKYASDMPAGKTVPVKVAVITVPSQDGTGTKSN
jgi:hypothetical protein